MIKPFQAAITNIMLLRNARIATIDEASGYGLIDNSAMAIEDGLIVWLGEDDAIPAEYRGFTPCDLQGRLITPALIDCHTHLVHGGNRAVEFDMRLKGVSYEDIARAGGGIMATVRATRAADTQALIKMALPRVDALIAEGISVIEVKSGYGLDYDTELNMLRAARLLEEQRPVRIKTSFLGAHALPVEYRGRPDAYLDDICLPTLRAAHAEGLVDAVDGFCEGIAFAPCHIKRVFDTAQALGIAVKLHAEQLSHTGGTRLAAQYGALSVDHLEYADADDALAMADAGSVAVLLPGAFYTLQETQKPPIEHFRKHNVAMAVATDGNPGTSPLSSILLSMNMACTLFALTPQEALAGVTVHAARALGLSDTGRIRPGLRADLAIWNVRHPVELAYHIGFNSLFERIFSGKGSQMLASQLAGGASASDEQLP